jgi:hypothetical protein
MTFFSLCTEETTDGDYARRIEWWWVRATNFIVYVSGMQGRLQESKQKA